MKACLMSTKVVEKEKESLGNTRFFVSKKNVYEKDVNEVLKKIYFC